MPIVPEIQDRLELAFPRSSNVTLYRAVQEGSFTASHLIAGDPSLNNDLGRDLHGHIRRVCISAQIQHYCERGDLPFRTEIKRMPRGPLHWLEITSTGAFAHVCRTVEARAFPDEAESRQDIRLVVQRDLLSWLDHGDEGSLGKIIKVIPRLYAWLTFHATGDGRIDHLAWASPAADVNEWLAYINLIDEIGSAGGDLPPIDPVPDPKDSLRLRDHVAEHIEKAKKPGDEG